jgi:prepilin-type N-terminal cleavage/methylation domain-containing protein
MDLVKSEKGYTIIELIIVIVVLCFLSFGGYIAYLLICALLKFLTS